MTVRAKIRVNSMTYFGRRDDSEVKVSFTAVYKDDPSHENKSFWKYTPQLNMEMTLSKEAKGAIAFFEDMHTRNVEMYLDFSEAPPS